MDCTLPFASSAPTLQRVSPPPSRPASRGYGKYCIRAVSKVSSKVYGTEIGKYTGMSEHLEIIEKTVEYCKRGLGHDRVCSDPEVTVVKYSDMCDSTIRFSYE